jgi:hypothetical protein
MKLRVYAATGIAALLACCLVRCTLKSSLTGGGDDVVTGAATGYLYCGDGKAAQGTIVKAIPAGALPVRIASADGQPDSAPAVYFSQTNAAGRYEFPSLLRGTYNLYSARDSLRAMLERVLIQGKVALPNDTLKAPGTIVGVVRLAGGEDCRAVLIMAMGADENLVASPRDTSGAFALKKCAEGQYRIRFMSMYSYPVLDTDCGVSSGKSTDIGTIILSKSR